MSAIASTSPVEGMTFTEDIDPHKHLQIVITAPVKATDQVIYVNLTSYRSDRPPLVTNDPACIIQRGEHPWVNHETCVCYNKAVMLTLAGFQTGIKAGVFLPWGAAADAALLEKIRSCAGDSKHMDIGVFQALEELGFV